jgi:hypothetical protein
VCATSCRCGRAAGVPVKPRSNARGRAAEGETFAIALFDPLPQGTAAVGLGALAVSSGFNAGRVIGTLAGGSFALVADQVANSGGAEALIVDTAGRLLDSRCVGLLRLGGRGALLAARWCLRSEHSDHPGFNPAAHPPPRHRPTATGSASRFTRQATS